MILIVITINLHLLLKLQFAPLIVILPHFILLDSLIIIILLLPTFPLIPINPLSLPP